MFRNSFRIVGVKGEVRGPIFPGALWAKSLIYWYMGIPKWINFIMENPMTKWDDLGGKPTILGKHPYMVNDTLQGTNISPKNGILKMIFLFPRWDMLVPWRVSAPGRWPVLRLPRPRPCLWFASSGGYRIESGVGCRWIPWGKTCRLSHSSGTPPKTRVI